MRTDFAWMAILNATHLNIHQLLNSPTPSYKLYDIAIYIPPKNINLNIVQVDKIRQFADKVAIMQEGPSWLFQDKADASDQFAHIAALQDADFLFCHNEKDRRYYSAFKNISLIHVLPPVLVEDNLKELKPPTERKNIILGGNMTRWYGAVDSLSVAQNIVTEDESICIPTMGRSAKNENLYFKKIEHSDWTKWMNILNNFRVGIHFMPTIAAGTFALNCAYLGIPCFGYSDLDTQRTCHPMLAFHEIFDAISYIKNRKDINDLDQFLKECGRDAKMRYELNYKEDVFLSNIKSILQTYL